jgi:hypothetical protein
LSPGHLLEFAEVVADRHGESQEPLQRFVRRREVNRDGSRRYGDAIGQICQFPIHYRSGRFDQYLGLGQCHLPQSFQDLGEPLPAPPFIMGLVAGRQTPQMRDEGFPVRYAVGSDLAGDAGPQDLLRSTGPDLKERLERFAIHPGPREGGKLGDDLIQSPIPDRFIGHWYHANTLAAIVRTCEK